MKNKLWVILSVSALLFLLLLAYGLGTKSAKRIAVDFTVIEKENQNGELQPHKYQFLEKSISDYICSLSEELDIDSDLIIAILMVENPEFNVEAIHRNKNGTIDCGLFQLNDRYLWTSFKDSYWFENLELDPFNWKHNSYIAIHHIAYLHKKMKVVDEAIMAYNCGATTVMSGNIPETTRVYLKKVKTNLYLLKGGKEQ